MSKNEDLDKFINSYTINTTKNEQLDVANIAITDIIFIKLTVVEGFKQEAPTNNFKLNFKSDDKQKQFEALVQLLIPYNFSLILTIEHQELKHFQTQKFF